MFEMMNGFFVTERVIEVGGSEAALSGKVTRKFRGFGLRPPGRLAKIRRNLGMNLFFHGPKTYLLNLLEKQRQERSIYHGKKSTFSRGK